MNNLAGLAVTAQEFAQLAELCRRDDKFPRNWSEWLQSALGKTSQARCEAPVPTLVAEHFGAWCSRLNIPPCVDALCAYAMVVSSPVRRAHYGAVSLN